MFGDRSLILLKDHAGNLLRMDSAKQGERVELVCRTDENHRESNIDNALVMTADPAGPGLELMSQKDNTRVKILISPQMGGGIDIYVKDGDIITFALEHELTKTKIYSLGSIEIDSEANITMQCKKFELRSALGIHNNSVPVIIPPVAEVAKWTDSKIEEYTCVGD